MINYDCIVWDFNGTLLDDVSAGISSVNTLLRERGLPTIRSREQYRELFRFPIIEYYRSLGFDFSAEPYEELAPKWVALYLENVKSAALCCGAYECLEEVRKLGIRQVILSATEQNMLKMQLKDLGIEGFFDEVMGLDNIHAGSKLGIALAWRERNKGKRVLLIGDTDHDAENARALGADCVLVCSGHQSREHLLTLGLPVVDTAAQILPHFRGE